MASGERADRILTIDIGNTIRKISVMEGEEVLETLLGSSATPDNMVSLVGRYGVTGAVFCAVGKDEDSLAARVRDMGITCLELDGDTPVPVTVDYDRHHLGPDRLAAVCGVAREGEDFLLADAGTALTLDMTSGMRYLGGNISPGIRLRIESLHKFTHRLPLVDVEGKTPLRGHDTHEAIRSGVLRGIAYEIAGTLQAVRESHRDVRLVLTGGNMPAVCRYLTLMGVPHTVDSCAVARGLVRIFKFRARSLKFRGRRGGSFRAGFSSRGGSDASIVTDETSENMPKRDGAEVILIPSGLCP